ncbi:hypothetical protein QJS10_CPA10g01997 [Acorus calamus]|uniref:Transcription initiation factor TFIID subunit 8 n=1 Tax=Acorus calamus TaxID=4465 RepID=A0AAV9E3V3_ACOCL|nr:hypothetical protein QJS10_CPB15g01411 [Acorus calamus]KAK1306772.1 hypothetical protein QJS10_CPA10g01997 [Acorus calamus]
MNDGGGASGGFINYKGDGFPCGGDRRWSVGDGDFGRAVTTVAAAQICESAGFHSVQRSALNALSDVAVRYLCALGKAARYYSNLSGRTECNVFDVIRGLEDLSASSGFQGASDVNHCLASSGVLRDIIHYVGSTEDVPFARHIPSFPIPRVPNPKPSFARLEEAPPGKHIPDWLPAFPDPHTYMSTPIWDEKEPDLQGIKLEEMRQRRKADRSLLSLEQKIIPDGLVPMGPPPMSDGGDAMGRGIQTVEGNPFLAPPIVFGERDVSPLVVPSDISDEPDFKKRVSVLDTFAPAIEAMRSGVFDHAEATEEMRVLPSKRPAVHFKLGVDKKSVATPLSVGGVGLNAVKVASDEKDDKKRRVEQILKEAMENPHGLTQS